MMPEHKALLLLSACVSWSLVAALNRFITKESLPAIPRGWTVGAPAPRNHILQLQIGLRQADDTLLYDILANISDPRHEQYGQHLQKEEVDALVRPHNTSSAALDRWLAFHQIPPSVINRNAAGDWVEVQVPVQTAERMLDTKYRVFQHEDGSSLVRCTSWSVPEDLEEHVEFIQPTTIFARQIAHRSFLQGVSPALLLAGPTNCTNQITPDCLRELYGVGSYSANASAPNRLGISGYLSSWANMNDTTHFYEEYAPHAYAANFSFSVEYVNGGLNPQSESSGSLEGNLDVQYGGALSFPIPNTYYSTGGSPPFIASEDTPSNTNEPYADFLSYLLNKTNDELPKTLSTSYGDEEQTVPNSYAVRVCNLFAQLGARGVSVIFSSGDGGVGDGSGPGSSSSCFSNDGQDTPMFLPVFPASCPYVTAVGATTGIMPEVATTFTGGGFSNYFERPYWQNVAVETYLPEIHSSMLKLYNASGRAYPDVSTQGANFVIRQGGADTTGFGTSCAAPTFAGLIALVNDFLLSRGKSPLGFLNPWLYIVGPVAFNDITIGNNPGCGTNGFNASIGWDPLTGVGTPNFTMILNLLSISL